MAYTTIDKPSKYFNTVLYTGNDASNRAITGVGFKPDLVWHKSRSNAFNHYLFDVIRGAGYLIFSNLADTQIDGTAGFKSFDTDGFTLTQEGGIEINKSAVTYAMWNWLGANTTVSNTAGTITSTVSANTTSGFSIVKFTGNGTGGATIGHGLGTKPNVIILKSYENGQQWASYWSALGATKNMRFNATGAQSTTSTRWNNTEPTSTLFTVGDDGEVNTSGDDHIAYCFADVKGYSKAFSYTGNGSTDGSFIYCGFLPSFVLLKRTDSAGFNWVIHDNKRDINNPDSAYLHSNTSGTESTDRDIDLLSNGFKMRNSNTTWNASGGTYIGIAFAEQPFVSSKGIVANAR